MSTQLRSSTGPVLTGVQTFFTKSGPTGVCGVQDWTKTCFVAESSSLHSVFFHWLLADGVKAGVHDAVGVQSLLPFVQVVSTKFGPVGAMYEHDCTPVGPVVTGVGQVVAIQFGAVAPDAVQEATGALVTLVAGGLLQENALVPTVRAVQL